MTGELHREHWRVPVRGLTPTDPDGIVQAIARRDGTVNLHVNCGESRTTVLLDVCRAAQLSSGSGKPPEPPSTSATTSPHHSHNPPDRETCPKPGAHTKTHDPEIAHRDADDSCPQ